MIDAVHNDAVTRFQAMCAVVKDKLDGAIQNDVEIDRVGVVRRLFAAWLPSSDRPAQSWA